MSERMRQRAQSLSAVDQMFGDGKRNYVRVVRSDGKEWHYSGRAVVKDQVALVDNGPGTRKDTVSLQHYSISGDVEFAGEEKPKKP